MYKIGHLFMLMALLCMPWLSQSQITSFRCDFENDADVSAWTLLNGDSTIVNRWCIDTAVCHGGSRSLYVSDDNGATNSYTISSAKSVVYAYRMLDLGAGLYDISFDWRGRGESSFDYMRVALVPANQTLSASRELPSELSGTELPSGWIALDGGTKLNLESEWTIYEGMCRLEQGGAYKLVFMWRNDGSVGQNPPSAIDNIVFEIPVCMKPTGLAVRDVLSDGATLTWNRGSDATSWSVEYGLEGFERGSGMFATVLDTSYVITGLEGNTLYDAYLNAECSEGSSNVVKITFRTQCAEMTFPYRESFENQEEYKSPMCWHVLDGTGKVYSNGYYIQAADGTKYLELTNGAVVASPYIPIGGNQLGLDFMLKKDDDYYDAGKIQVGFVTDTVNWSNMTILKTIDPRDDNFTLYEIELDTFTNYEGGYIIWKQVDYEVDYYYGEVASYYLDDVYIRQLSSCRRPKSMSVLQVKHTSANLNWPSVVDASSYEVVYGTVDSVEDAMNSSVVVSENSVMISDLMPNTTYYTWLRNDCGSEMSEWRVGPSFTTQIACASVVEVAMSNVSNFAGAVSWRYQVGIGADPTHVLVEWKKQDEGVYNRVVTDNDYYIFAGLEAGVNYEYRLSTICESDTAEAVVGAFTTSPCGRSIEGNQSVSKMTIPMGGNYDYSYSQMLYPARDLVGLDTIKAIAYNVESSTRNQMRTVTVYMKNTTQASLSASSYIPVDSMTVVATDVSHAWHEGWCVLNLTTPFVYDGTSNLVIAMDDNTGAYNGFEYVYTHDGTSLYIRKDDVNINPSMPGSMTFLNSVPDIIFVEPCTDDICSAPVLAVAGETSTEVSLVWTGGASDTWQVEYKVDTMETWMVAGESITDTSFVITNLNSGTFYDIRVGTICAHDTLYAQVSVFTNCAAIEIPYLETFSTGNLNPCWVVENTEDYSAPYISSNELYMGYSSGGYAILPEFVDELNTLHILFKFKNSNGGGVAICAGTNPSDWSTFTMLDTLEVTTNSWESHMYDFTDYEGTGHYIAFYAIDGTCRIDDVRVELAPVCAIPTGVEYEHVTAEGAKITWSGNSAGSDEWVVKYRNLMTNEIGEVGVDASLHNYVLTGLSADTEYEVMVYNVCGGDSVESFNSVTFRTLCGELELPYRESFENKPLNEFPTCWTSIKGENSVVNAYSNTNDGTRALEIVKGTVVSPYIPIPANTIMLDFILTRNDSDGGKMVVGFTTNLNNLDSMRVITTITPTNDEPTLYELEFDTLSISESGYIVWKQIDYSTYYYGYNEYYLDGVYIRELADCRRPVTASASRVTYNQAYLNWPSVEGATSYEVMYSMIDDLNNLNNMVVRTTADTLLLTDLISDTTYYAWVRTVCSESSVSDWRSIEPFRTQVSCATLNHAYIENISNFGAALSWDYSEGIGMPHTQVEVAWKKTSDSIYNKVITQNDYYILSGLESSTAYDCRLRTICGEDTSREMVGHFTTLICGSVVEGNQSSTTNYLPMGGFYDYSYSQMMYSANEMTGVDTIKAIAFNVSSTSQGQTRTVTVYMANTTQTTLTTTTAIPISSMTEVATNVQHIWTEGWCVLNLTTPFVYDGTSSLVIAIDDNTGDYHGSEYVYTHSGKSLYKRRDDTNIDPNSPGTLSVLSVVPDIAFVGVCNPTDCVAPILTVADVTSTSVDLVWANQSTHPTWQVEYKVEGVEHWTVIPTLVTTNSYSVTNLNPGTFYDFRVGTICGTDTFYSYTDAFTDCAAIDVPYSENFIGNQINPCWVVGNVNEGGKPNLSSDALSMSYDAGGYVILPEFVENISNLRLLFKVKSSNANTQVAIMVGTNPNNWNSFIPIDTVGITEINVYQPQACVFSDYTGEGHYIALYSMTQTTYIDDIKVELAPECSMPTDITVSNITSDGVDVSWTGETTATNHWLIEYRALNNSMAISQTVQPTVNNQYTLSGLTPNTQYMLMVSNICNNGDTVEALMPVKFRTECGTITLPYFANFENEIEDEQPSCWFSTQVLNYSYHTAPTVYDVYNHGKSLMFGNNCDIITPRVPVEANQITVIFDAKASNASHTGDLVVGFTPSNTSLANMIAVDTVELTTNWTNYRVAFTNLTTTDMGYVVFKNINNTSEYSYGSTYYYNGYIDDVMIMVDYGCGEVTNTVVSNVTETSVDLAFTDSNAIGSYSIGYNNTNDLNNIQNIVDITSSSYTLTGLQSGLRYYVYIRTNCAEGVSQWVPFQSFVTPCSALDVPYVENFDDYVVDISTSTTIPDVYPIHTLPSCWTFLNMSLQKNQYPRAFLMKPSSSYTSKYADSVNCLLMHSKNSGSIYAILPNFTTPVNDLRIKFKYCNESMNNSNGELSIGVMTNIVDTNSFMSVYDCPISNQLTAVDIDLSLDTHLVAGTNYTLAFRYKGNANNYYVSIDDVQVLEAPDCPHPIHVVVNSVSSTSATVSWIGQANSYEIQYKADGNTAWSSMISNTTTVILSNLTSNTRYKVRVQANCGTSVSEWSNEVTFATTCELLSIPYSENFDSYTIDVSDDNMNPDNYPNHRMPDCWNFPLLSDHGSPIFMSTYAGYYDDEPYAVSGACLFIKSKVNEDAYAVLPGFVTRIDSLRIKFTYRNETNSMSCGQVSLGVMTNPLDTSTYINLETYPRSMSFESVEHVFTFDSLDTNTTYYITIRNADANYGNYYTGIDNVIVDRAPTCPQLTTPTISNITSNSVVVHMNGTVNSYEINYKKDNDSSWMSIVTTNNIHNLVGLIPITDYVLRARAFCSPTDTSEWSEEVLFTTNCATFNLPFLEDFDNVNGTIANLHCWNRYKGLLNDIQAGTSTLEPNTSSWGTWKIDTYDPILQGGANAMINIYRDTEKDWLVTPSINLTTVVNLEFDLGRHDAYSFSNKWDNDDMIAVLITTDNGTTWTELQRWQDTAYKNIPLCEDSAQHVVINLGQYAGTVAQIAFYAQSTYDSDADHYIHIDNVAIGDGVSITCPVPTNLGVDSIIGNTAFVSWQGTAGYYEINYRKDNDIWMIDSTHLTSYVITHLEAESNYEWRIRSICAGEMSPWSSSSFDTPEEIDCETPSDLVARVDDISVTLTWNADDEQHSWEINLLTSTGENTIHSATTNPITINNLIADISYQVAIRAICAEGVYSDWSDTVIFNTGNCTTVSNLEIIEITAHSAQVKWTVGGDESTWQVMYGDMGFEHGDEIIMETTSIPYALTDLESGHYYDVYVRAICGEGFYSEWSAKKSFLTKYESEDIDGVEGNFQLSIYPNPATGSTIISLDGVGGKVTIYVVDMNGRIVVDETMECGIDFKKSIDVTLLSQGTYFVKVLGDNVNSVRKLIVK